MGGSAGKPLDAGIRGVAGGEKKRKHDVAGLCLAPGNQGRAWHDGIHRLQLPAAHHLLATIAIQIAERPGFEDVDGTLDERRLEAECKLEPIVIPNVIDAHLVRPEFERAVAALLSDGNIDEGNIVVAQHE
jgi:hypothetical protein